MSKSENDVLNSNQLPRRYFNLEKLYRALSLEYENMKIRLEELEIENNALLEHVLHHRMNRRLVVSKSLEKTRDWSKSSEELKVYFQAGEQEVNLNCAFLYEKKKNYACHWDFSNESLESCVGCVNPTVFVKKLRKRVKIFYDSQDQEERNYHVQLEG
ncbi:MAG: hypothetical protein ACXAEU_19480 [Candidatus Hodarchaeales archaeon]|jgi:hypothetical protein